MERGVICYKPTHTERNKKEIQINFRSVKSRSMEDWNLMKLSRGGLMADSARRVARNHAPCRTSKTLHPQKCQVQQKTWRWRGGAGHKRTNWYRVTSMSFPKIYECPGVYLPDKNKESGFFEETKWTGESWGSSVWAPAAHSKTLHTLALGLALGCPALRDCEQLPTASWISMSKPSGIRYQKDACNKRQRQTEKWPRKWR